MLFVVGEVGATAGSLGSILSEQEGSRGSSPGAVSGAWVIGAGVEWAPGGGGGGGQGEPPSLLCILQGRGLGEVSQDRMQVLLVPYSGGSQSVPHPHHTPTDGAALQLFWFPLIGTCS